MAQTANLRPLLQPDEEQAPAPAIAVKIELAHDIGGGQKVNFISYVDRDASILAYRELLDKMSGAADWLGAKYALRNLRLQLEQEEKYTIQLQEGYDELLKRAQDAWVASGRRGEFKPHGTQQSTLSNHQNSIASRKQVIEKIKKDIGITEAILKANG